MEQGTIVVLDDSPAALAATKQALESGGYRVATLTSPFLLIGAIQREKPLAVLIDLTMPTLSAERVLEIAGRAGAFTEAVALVYSSEPTTAMPAVVARTGADGYLSAWRDAADLIQQIEREVNAARARRGIRPPAPRSVPLPPVEAPAPREESPTTLVWHEGLERLMPNEASPLLRKLREERPRLLILDGRTPHAQELIRQVRADLEVGHVTIAALLDSTSQELEPALRAAGATMVLSEWQSTPAWDHAFQDLLKIPPRHWMTARVDLSAGAQPQPGRPSEVATAHSLSVRGMLLEVARPLPLGSLVHVSFTLGSPARIEAVGRVAWGRTRNDGTEQQGIEFVGFHGDALDRIGQLAPARGTANRERVSA